MKKLIVAAITMMSTMSGMAQDIQLPAVDMNQKTKSIMETLETRHSVREYSTKMLSNQELSNLCWAACGRSRDDQHRTAPTAMNRKEIRLYVFTADAAYEYLPVENKLKFIVKGDNRKLVAGGQNFVEQAPVSLVMVMDMDRFGSANEHAMKMTCVDAGIVCQNINLYCEAAGLVTVPRGTMDAAGISRVLGLTDKQVPVLNNPVGYAK